MDIYQIVTVSIWGMGACLALLLTVDHIKKKTPKTRHFIVFYTALSSVSGSYAIGNISVDMINGIYPGSRELEKLILSKDSNWISVAINNIIEISKEDNESWRTKE